MNELMIKLEDEIVEACENRIRGTEFDSAEEYIAFIVTEVVFLDDIKTRETRDNEDPEDQLRALGYLD